MRQPTYPVQGRTRSTIHPLAQRAARITAGSASPMNNQVVTTSNSIVTIPIIDKNLSFHQQPVQSL